MKYNPLTIPIPQLMLDHCERDPRGYPVPYVVFKDKTGKHHFKINDSEKSAICMVKTLCTICGQPMTKDDRWLVGGIASAFDKNGSYIDLPVHKECGHYALKVCPYLAIRNYNGKIDLEKMIKETEAVLHNPTIDQDRLPLFVFTRPTTVQYILKSNGVFIVPVKPYHEVQFWDEGQQITDLAEIINRLSGTKWEQYLIEIQKLPQYANTPQAL